VENRVFNRRCYTDLPVKVYFILIIKKGNKLSGFDTFEDLHDCLYSLHEKYPDTSVYLLGFSLGGMFTQRYLEDYGDRALAKAAVTISSAWNAKLSSIKLSKLGICMTVLIDYIKDRLRSHYHEEHFRKVLKEKGIDWGSYLINN